MTFRTGDRVLVLNDGFGLKANVPYMIDDDDSGECLIEGNWYDEDDLRAVPPLPAPPKFSSPEEADAWLEAQARGVTLELIPPTDTFARGPNDWLVQVFRPDGSLAFQAGAEILHRTDPEDVRTMLTVAQETAESLPF